MTSRKTRGESRAGAEEHEVSLVAAQGGTLRPSRQRGKRRFEANRLMCPWNSGISFRSMALAPSLPEEKMIYQETFGQRNRHRTSVREYPGEEPAIILIHGFPDNLHLS